MEQIINNTQNDTIDLRELFPILKRRKKLIFLVTILITIVAIVYAFYVAKPVYEVKALMEMAQVDKKPVQNVVDLKEKIEVLFEVKKKKKKIKFPLVSRISLPKKTKNMIIIQAQGYDNRTAQQKLQEVTNHIILLQDKELNSFTDIQKKRLDLTKEDIDRNEKLSIKIKKDINIYENKLLNISKQDTSLAVIYAMEVGRSQTELNKVASQIYELKNKINDLKLSISPLKIQKATIIGKVTVLNKPIEPKKKLIVIIAFITGLMLSIFLVFFLEFIAGMKKEEISE